MAYSYEIMKYDIIKYKNICTNKFSKHFQIICFGKHFDATNALRTTVRLFYEKWVSKWGSCQTPLNRLSLKKLLLRT